MNKKSLWKLILILAIPCIIGFMPAPAGLSELAWVLFGIYLDWRWQEQQRSTAEPGEIR